MNKKTLSILLILISILFTSCWIYPDIKNYSVIDNVYYFEDYETMKSVIIPMINKSFTAWHWDGDEFDEKYQKYFGNIDSNIEYQEVMNENGQAFAVKNAKELSLDGKKLCSGEYYWITTKEEKGVLFYQN